MRKDARTNLQNLADLIATEPAGPGPLAYFDSPTAVAAVLKIPKSTAHAALERLAEIAKTTGKTMLEAAAAIHATPLANLTSCGPTTVKTLVEKGLLKPDAVALAEAVKSLDAKPGEGAASEVEPSPAEPPPHGQTSLDLAPAPAPAPAKSGISALLSQAAHDIEDLSAKNHSLTQQVEELKALAARASARPEPKPAAGLADEDKVHVPAPFPNWSPLPIEPALDSCARNGWPVALVGPPGCGKSEVLKQTAARLGRPYIRVACSDGATVGDIIGRREVSDGSTRWNDGPTAKGARRGYSVTLDEIGAAPAGVLAAVHDLAASGSMHIPATGETIKAAGGWWLTATSNFLGSDRVDTTHEQPISAALADRFVVFQIDYGNEKQEAEIARRVLGLSAGTASVFEPAELSPLTTIAPALVDEMSALLSDLRAAEKAGDVSGPYSRRRLIDLVRLWLAWGGTNQGQRLAVRGALLDRHPPSQQEIVKGLIQRRLGVSL